MSTLPTTQPPPGPLTNWSRASRKGPPKYLLRDRDAIYGDVFVRRVNGLGMSEVLIAPWAPWQNPFAERVIGSIRRECLDFITAISAPPEGSEIIVARYS